MADTNRTRVQFDFSEDALQRLDAIQQETRAKTRAEVIRNALRLYEWFYHEFKDEKEVTIGRSTGKPVTIPTEMLF